MALGISQDKCQGSNTRDKLVIGRPSGSLLDNQNSHVSMPLEIFQEKEIQS